ncbi:MerR family transcriptional regulator [Pseudonocardia sp. GCM10023141]|uniref:MerR family transcriptional regulator n=1 Tax=Pseudonocardia sp. GCM10023141 TaxID=3252653 RepID=UPI0036174FC0
MRMGSFSRATGVSERLLRYYEEQGLLRPARLASGHREYAEADVATVAHIRGLLAAGLTTATIGQVLPCVAGGERMVPNCPELAAMLQRERRRISESIEQLQHSRQLIDEVLAAKPEAPALPRRDRVRATAPTS